MIAIKYLHYGYEGCGENLKLLRDPLKYNSNYTVKSFEHLNCHKKFRYYEGVSTILRISRGSE